ncbi:MAG: hypothetical protein FWE34_03515 [Defluviitaleaceae bacterium]|nr:hypothetical protein [Defluviitaleaceae bacterium]
MSFLLVYMLGMTVFQVGMGIGLFNSLFTHQAIREPGIKDDVKWRFYLIFHYARNIIFSLALCIIIAELWPVLQNHVVPIWDLEPLTFGLVYGIVHTVVLGLLLLLCKYLPASFKRG